MKKIISFLFVLAILFAGYKIVTAKSVYHFSINMEKPMQTIAQEKASSPDAFFNSYVENVLVLAKEHVKKYGPRPLWPGVANKKDWIPSPNQIPDVIARLMACESNNQDVPSHLDSNNEYSYGRLQFQKKTWDAQSKKAGIDGDPEHVDDAIMVAKWAIEHGMLSQWSCAFILKILEK